VKRKRVVSHQGGPSSLLFRIVYFSGGGGASCFAGGRQDATTAGGKAQEKGKPRRILGARAGDLCPLLSRLKGTPSSSTPVRKMGRGNLPPKEGGPWKKKWQISLQRDQNQGMVSPKKITISSDSPAKKERVRPNKKKNAPWHAIVALIGSG